MSGAWFSRVEREFEAGNLTRAQRDVLKALGRFTGCRFGIFPSHAFLAARVKCCVRTVQRALQAARELGLVTWAAQRVRAGWRSLRASNRYVLTLPESGVGLCLAQVVISFTSSLIEDQQGGFGLARAGKDSSHRRQ